MSTFWVVAGGMIAIALIFGSLAIPPSPPDPSRRDPYYPDPDGVAFGQRVIIYCVAFAALIVGLFLLAAIGLNGATVMAFVIAVGLWFGGWTLNRRFDSFFE